MLRPILPRVRHSFVKSFRRRLHNVPPLDHDFTNGIPGLLSPAGFDMAWTQYQSLMIEKLNNLTAGGEYESADTKSILLKYARDPSSAPIFNYASMAHNNHLFFQKLTPDPKPMPSALKADLEKSFGSIETLQREFVVTASSMFGPGFVWLVKTAQGKYSLLCTYMAGSPYPGAHYRRQPVDMNTEDKTVSEAIRRIGREAPTNTVGVHGHLSKKPIAPGGIDVQAVLCINMWEHVYLADYGVGAGGAGGKKAFAESWWHAVDWDKVAVDADANMTRNMMR